MEWRGFRLALSVRNFTPMSTNLPVCPLFQLKPSDGASSVRAAFRAFRNRQPNDCPGTSSSAVTFYLHDEVSKPLDFRPSLSESRKGGSAAQGQFCSASKLRMLTQHSFLLRFHLMRQSPG